VPDPREVHRTATRILSSIMVVLGVVLIVLTIAQGGGPISLGTILGILFLLAGILRLRVERERAPR
jgi:multisubunit Na+/H+ antiporter MnhG subunit